MAERPWPKKITPVMLKMQATDVGKLIRSESDKSGISSAGRNPVPESPTVRSPSKTNTTKSQISDFHQEVPEPGLFKLCFNMNLKYNRLYKFYKSNIRNVIGKADRPIDILIK